MQWQGPGASEVDEGNLAACQKTSTAEAVGGLPEQLHILSGQQQPQAAPAAGWHGLIWWL